MSGLFALMVVGAGLMTGYYYEPIGSIQLDNWRGILVLVFASMLGIWTMGL